MFFVNKLFFVYVKRAFLPLLICWLLVILIFGLGGIANLLIAVHTGDWLASGILVLYDGDKSYSFFGLWTFREQKNS